MINTIVNEFELSFNRLEKEIYAASCRMTCETLKNLLEELDKKLAEERDKEQRKTILQLLRDNKIEERLTYIAELANSAED